MRLALKAIFEQTCKLQPGSSILSLIWQRVDSFVFRFGIRMTQKKKKKKKGKERKETLTMP